MKIKRNVLLSMFSCAILVMAQTQAFVNPAAQINANAKAVYAAQQAAQAAAKASAKKYTITGALYGADSTIYPFPDHYHLGNIGSEAEDKFFGGRAVQDYLDYCNTSNRCSMYRNVDVKDKIADSSGNLKPGLTVSSNLFLGVPPTQIKVLVVTWTCIGSSCPAASGGKVISEGQLIVIP